MKAEGGRSQDVLEKSRVAPGQTMQGLRRDKDYLGLL